MQFTKTEATISGMAGKYQWLIENEDGEKALVQSEEMANLLHAAPDMLRAISMAHAWFQDYESLGRNFGPLLPGHDEARRALENALSQAGGA